MQMQMLWPEGAGQLQCAALWDLESCPLPAAVLQHGLGPAAVCDMQQRFGATKVIGSAGTFTARTLGAHQHRTCP